jgi:type I restriction enzyme S subunit
VKKGWEIRKLSDACDRASSNVSQNRLENENGSYPIFGASGLIKKVSFYHQEKPYLSIVKDGSGCGRVTKMEAHTSVIGTLQYILPKEGIDLNYLYYNLISIDFKKYIQGAAIPHIYFKDYKDEPFLWMPLEEQKHMAFVLDQAFTAIDRAKANAERNLRNLKELFESYRSFLLECEKNFVAIGTLCKLTRGQNPPKSKFINEPRKGYVRFYQIRDGSSDNYPVYVPDSPQLHRVSPEELLIVAYRHVGKVFRGVSGAFNVALCKLTNVSPGTLDSDYLYYLIPTEFVRGELLKRSERSLIPSMSIDHLREIIIPLPKLNQQKLIVGKLETMMNNTKNLENFYIRKINEYDELKKSLLQKAFSGQLKTAPKEELV